MKKAVKCCAMKANTDTYENMYNHMDRALCICHTRNIPCSGTRITIRRPRCRCRSLLHSRIVKRPHVCANRYPAVMGRCLVSSSSLALSYLSTSVLREAACASVVRSVEPQIYWVRAQTDSYKARHMTSSRTNVH